MPTPRIRCPLNSHRLDLLLASVAAACWLVAACGPQAEQDLSEETYWGVGHAKADQICPDNADFCWLEESGQPAIMRRIYELEPEILSASDPRVAMRELLDLLWQLEPKFKSGWIAPDGTVFRDEREILGEVQRVFDGLAADAPASVVVDLLARLNGDRGDGPLFRLKSAYVFAQLAEIGQLAEQQERVGGLADVAASAGQGTAFSPPGISEDMQESLQLIRDVGLSGKTMAATLEFLGLLERDYPLLTEDTWGRTDPATGRWMPTGQSREERADSTIRWCNAAAFGVGAATAGVRHLHFVNSAVTLSAVAGNVIGLFPIHAYMALKIGALYGLDIQQHRNLIRAVLLISLGDLTPDTIDHVSAAFLSGHLQESLTHWGKQALTIFGGLFAGGTTFKVALHWLIDASGKSAAKQGTVAIIQGAGGMVLGWGAWGVSMLVSGAIDSYMTDAVGDRMKVCARPWLKDLKMNGTAYLAAQSTRDCALSSLSVMAWADGTLSEREEKLLMAVLAKPYYAGKEKWFFLSRAEVTRTAAMLAGSKPSSGARERALACAEDELTDQDAADKVDFLHLLYAMMWIDLQAGPDESRFYSDMRNLLDGDRFWGDGPAIEPANLSFAENVVHGLLIPWENPLLAEYAEELRRIRPEDSLEFMRNPDPVVASDFRCGLDGVCY